MENKYYVYVYLDVRKKGNYDYGNYKFEYEPFYIGKGCGNRYLKHLTETKEATNNIFKFRIIDKLSKLGLKPMIIKIAINLFELDAYKLETELIKTIGRRCNKSGLLTNILIDVKPPSNYKQLNKKTIKKIFDLYHEGKYLKHIGKELGLNETKVKQILIENGIKPKRNPPPNKLKLTDEIVKNMVDEYNSGSSIRIIKNKYGISFEAVRNRLKENNVSLRGYDYPKTIEHIKKIHKNRKKLLGEDNPCFKKLTTKDINRLRILRFDEKKTIHQIMKIMKINQKKYYYYINM